MHDRAETPSNKSMKELNAEVASKQQEIDGKKNQLHLREELLLVKKKSILKFLHLSTTVFHSNINFSTCPPNPTEKTQLLREFMCNSKELTGSYNELFLLGLTPDVNSSLKDMINHLSSCDNPNPSPEFLKQMGVEYATLKDRILIDCRKYTQQERQNIIDICATQTETSEQ